MIQRAREIYDSVGQVADRSEEGSRRLYSEPDAGRACCRKRFDWSARVMLRRMISTRPSQHGLGLRWSFMGPFETIELNAPGGIRDYCERFGPTMYGLSKLPVTEELWSKRKLDRSWRAGARARACSKSPRKALWRDERLAALVVHKREQKQLRLKIVAHRARRSDKETGSTFRPWRNQNKVIISCAITGSIHTPIDVAASADHGGRDCGCRDRGGGSGRCDRPSACA